jgi:hypothetical protein
VILAKTTNHLIFNWNIKIVHRPRKYQQRYCIFESSSMNRNFSTTKNLQQQLVYITNENWLKITLWSYLDPHVLYLENCLTRTKFHGDLINFGLLSDNTNMYWMYFNLFKLHLFLRPSRSSISASVLQRLIAEPTIQSTATNQSLKA